MLVSFAAVFGLATQRSSPQTALRDEPKNGGEGDYQGTANRKLVPSSPRLSFWTVWFRHNQGAVSVRIQYHGHHANNTAKLSPARQSITRNYNSGMNCLLWTSQPVFYLMRWSSSMPAANQVHCLSVNSLRTWEKPISDPVQILNWFLPWKLGCLFVWPEVRLGNLIKP